MDKELEKYGAEFDLILFYLLLKNGTMSVEEIFKESGFNMLRTILPRAERLEKSGWTEIHKDKDYMKTTISLKEDKKNKAREVLREQSS